MLYVDLPIDTQVTSKLSVEAFDKCRAIAARRKTAVLLFKLPFGGFRGNVRCLS